MERLNDGEFVVKLMSDSNSVPTNSEFLHYLTMRKEAYENNVI